MPTTLPPTYTYHLATSSDADTITAHRRAMFASMHHHGFTEAELDDMATQFHAQIGPLLERGEYLGYLLEHDGKVVAGAGVLREVRLARPRLAPTERGYIGNVWVDEPHRRRGLARWMMEHLLADCAARNIREVWLYATDMGRPLYEELGFQRDGAWILRMPSD